MFADGVALTNDEAGGFAAVFFILRFAADGAEGEDAVVAPDFGVPAQYDVRADFAAVANCDVRAYDAPRADGDVFAKDGTVFNDGAGVDALSHVAAP